MPKIKLPSGSGEWRLLAERDQVQLWERIMDHPARGTVTFYVVGSENTPEIVTDQSMSKARDAFKRFQLLARY